MKKWDLLLSKDTSEKDCAVIAQNVSEVQAGSWASVFISCGLPHEPCHPTQVMTCPPPLTHIYFLPARQSRSLSSQTFPCILLPACSSPNPTHFSPPSPGEPVLPYSLPAVLGLPVGVQLIFRTCGVWHRPGHHADRRARLLLGSTLGEQATCFPHFCW